MSEIVHLDEVTKKDFIEACGRAGGTAHTGDKGILCMTEYGEIYLTKTKEGAKRVSIIRNSKDNGGTFEMINVAGVRNITSTYPNLGLVIETNQMDVVSLSKGKITIQIEGE